MAAGAPFGQLRDAMALMARAPDRVVDAEFETLGGAVGEYLEDLPYRSEIIGLEPALWTALYEGAAPGEQVFRIPLSRLP